jgi:hypothetical protein
MPVFLPILLPFFWRQMAVSALGAILVNKENDVRECDEDDLFEQCMAEGIDRGLDQLRTVVERNNMNARRQSGFDLLDFLFYPVDHFVW